MNRLNTRIIISPKSLAKKNLISLLFRLVSKTTNILMFLIKMARKIVDYRAIYADLI